ncbi:MAG: hypothetical protein AB7I27_00970 [Bacteriovoracaceae bacterium]
MKTLILTIILTTGFAHAKEVGNGGDAVVCPDRVVLLDYVEMEKRKMTLDLPGKTMKEKLLAVTARIKKIDLYRGKLVEQYALELESDISKKNAGETNLTQTDFTTDVLSDVPDSNEITIPAGCKKDQLVTQRTPVFKDDKRYTIADSIWNQLDLNQQTLTVLHESWYRVFINEGATDSRYARYINGTFASEELSTPDIKEYIKRLKLAANIGSFNGQRLYYKIEFQGVVQELYDWHRLKNGEPDYAESFYDSDMNLLLYACIEYKKGNFQIEGNSIKAASIRFAVIKSTGEVQSINIDFGKSDENKFRIQNIELQDFHYFDLTVNSENQIKAFNGVVHAIFEDNKLVKKTNGFFPFMNINGKVEDGKVSYTYKRKN